MHKQLSAGFIIFTLHHNQPYYLLLQYTHGNHWDFPKGKIEIGETEHQAAIRELTEETGIDLSNPAINATFYPTFEASFSYNFINQDNIYIHKTVFYFLAQVSPTQVTLSNEHTHYDWLPYNQALQKLTYTNAQNTLIAIHNFLKKINT